MVSDPVREGVLSAQEAGFLFALHWNARHTRQEDPHCGTCRQLEADLIRATDAELDAEGGR